MRVVSRFLVFVALGALVGCSPPATTDAGSDAGATDATRSDIANADTITPDTGNVTDTGNTDDTGMQAQCAATSCGECTPQDGCGWCASSNSCVPGTQDGSDDGACTGSNWTWLPAMCPSAQADCAAHSGSCDDCTAQNFCGWCPGMGCFPGTADGPFMGGAQSTCGGWSWQAADCAGPSDGGPDVEMPDVEIPDVVLPDVVRTDAGD